MQFDMEAQREYPSQDGEAENHTKLPTQVAVMWESVKWVTGPEKKQGLTRQYDTERKIECEWLTD